MQRLCVCVDGDIEKSEEKKTIKNILNYSILIIEVGNEMTTHKTIVGVTPIKGEIKWKKC